LGIERGVPMQKGTLRVQPIGRVVPRAFVRGRNSLRGEVVREIEGELRRRSITGIGCRSIENGDIDHYYRKQ
jgi:hypothetical protein